MQGERWKDIPGLEGRFAVSNYGRVKSHFHKRHYGNGVLRARHGKIIKLTLVKNPSKAKGDKNVFLAVNLTLSKKRYYFTIARLVYYSFVEPMDLADGTGLIITVDGDDLNIRPENLRAIHRISRDREMLSEKQSTLRSMPWRTRLKQKYRKI
jgi:hypothetical protein